MCWRGLLFMAFILYSPAGLAGFGARAWTQYRKLAGKSDIEAAAMASRHAPQPGQAVPEFLRGRARENDAAILDCEGVRKHYGEFVAGARAELLVADRCRHA